MPLNLLKTYNSLLELNIYNDFQRKQSLLGIFNRDIANNENFRFKGKQITPTPADGVIKMETLFTHLTTVIIDKATRKREFDLDRSVRLHWVKYHIEERKPSNMYLFSIKEPDGLRTYLYDKDEKYVIIFEPLRDRSAYYLITAYYLKGKDAKRDKIMKKYNRRLNEIL